MNGVSTTAGIDIPVVEEEPPVVYSPEGTHDRADNHVPLSSQAYIRQTRAALIQQKKSIHAQIAALQEQIRALGMQIAALEAEYKSPRVDAPGG